jgi:hypothetical protein
MTPPINSVSDERPWPLGGYAPGNYTCKCVRCGNQFEGDKRAYECLECAARQINTALRAANTPVGYELRYYVDNPSAWISFDQKLSDLIAAHLSASPALPSQVVDDKTIERAAKAIAESAGDVAWEKIEPLYQEGYRDEALAALAAALTLPERGM